MNSHAALESAPQIRQPNHMTRQARIKPGMCGPNSLFVGQVGDWTWDAVSQFCGTDVYSACNEAGSPTYLGFYYYHVRASPGLHLGSLTFGDLVQVDSQVYGLGSESVLTLHHIRRAEDVSPDEPSLTLETFYGAPPVGAMYIQNFNRWLVRSDGSSNENLQRSSPVDFVSEHLPTVPDAHSPRRIYDQARRSGSFLDPEKKQALQCAATARFDYRVDITRDLNGVGLLYFASYFSIVDRAILNLWQQLGWDDHGFMARTVLEHQICFVGNANMGALLELDTELWVESLDPAGARYFNVVIREKGMDRLMAVATVKL